MKKQRELKATCSDRRNVDEMETQIINLFYGMLKKHLDDNYREKIDICIDKDEKIWYNTNDRNFDSEHISVLLIGKGDE